MSFHYNTYDEERSAWNAAKEKDEPFYYDGVKIIDKYGNNLYPNDRIGIFIGNPAHVEELGHVGHIEEDDGLFIRCEEGYLPIPLNEVVKMDL